MRRLMTIAVVVAAGLAPAASPGQVWSQNTGRAGMFGDRTVGTTLSAGTRTLGASSTPGRTGTSGVATDVANVGQVDASDRFVRAARQPGQFVGTTAADAQQFVGMTQTGAAGGARAGAATQIPTAGGRAVQAGRGAAQAAGRTAGRTASDLRLPVSVAFDYPQPAATQRAADLGQRLQAVPSLQFLGPVVVTVDEGTATLRGAVATLHDRELAERLVRLEAGIWQVQNDLQVASAPAPTDLP